MGKSELKQKIMTETQNLSFETLVEVLDFIQFLKVKKERHTQKSLEDSVSKELTELNKISLLHLEEEFENYKESYPYE